MSAGWYPPAAAAKRGTAVFSGNAVLTSFAIPHGLGAVPGAVSVEAGSAVAGALFAVTALDATNITVTFVVAPAVGAGNVTLYWVAYP